MRERLRVIFCNRLISRNRETLREILSRENLTFFEKEKDELSFVLFLRYMDFTSTLRSLLSFHPSSLGPR